MVTFYSLQLSRARYQLTTAYRAFTRRAPALRDIRDVSLAPVVSA